MTDLAIDIQGLTQTQARIGRIPALANDAQRAGIRALGERYLVVLQDETPRGRGENPGALAAAYQTEESTGGDEVVFRITNRAPYLRYVLQGRGPVEARNGRSLRFVIDGQVIFRKSVGPAEANNFPSRARARMQPEIDQAKREIVGLIVRGTGT